MFWRVLKSTNGSFHFQTLSIVQLPYPMKRHGGLLHDRHLTQLYKHIPSYFQTMHHIDDDEEAILKAHKKHSMYEQPNVQVQVKAVQVEVKPQQASSGTQFTSVTITQPEETGGENTHTDQNRGYLETDFWLHRPIHWKLYLTSWNYAQQQRHVNNAYCRVSVFLHSDY